MKWNTLLVASAFFALVSARHPPKRGKSRQHLRQEALQPLIEIPTPETTTAAHIQATETTAPTTTPADAGTIAPLPELISTLEPNCGFEINGLNTRSGLITSPDYPSDYPDNQYCIWRIKAGPGKRVSLNFTDFDISGSDNCEGDRISVTSSERSLLDQRFCGSTVPQVLETEGEDVILEFRSNEEDTCKGFKAEFTIEDIVVSCGAQSSVSQFVFQSPKYPRAIANTTDECEVNVSHECSVPICQIRLDFLDFELQPPDRGDCNHDKFMVRANEPIPILCGINSGQHMYIDVKDRASTSLHVLSNPINPKPVGHELHKTLAFDTAGGWEYEYNGTRRWSIRVTQIPCDCAQRETSEEQVPRAPSGCLQYYTDVRETFRSFNYGGKKLSLDSCWNVTDPECGKVVKSGHLNGLDYSICVKPLPNYCSIMYKQTHNDSFALTGVPGTDIMYGISSCQSDYIHIPGGLTPNVPNGKPHDRFCGAALGNYAPGPVISSAKPFSVQVVTDEDESTTSNDVENGGFELVYQQLPCSMSETFVGKVWK